MKSSIQNFPKKSCSKSSELNEIPSLYTKQESTNVPDSLTLPYNISSLQQDKDYFLGSYHEAPKYMQDNIYILTGYRINFDTCKKSLKSCFMFSNNEFSNIWSHFIGIIIAISLIITLSSFVVKNDTGIIQKTIGDLENTYDLYSGQIQMSDKQVNTKLNTLKHSTTQTTKMLSDNLKSNNKFNKIISRINSKNKRLSKYYKKLHCSQKNIQLLNLRDNKFIQYTQTSKELLPKNIVLLSVQTIKIFCFSMLLF